MLDVLDVPPSWCHGGGIASASWTLGLRSSASERVFHRAKLPWGGLKPCWRPPPSSSSREQQRRSTAGVLAHLRSEFHQLMQAAPTGLHRNGEVRRPSVLCTARRCRGHWMQPWLLGCGTSGRAMASSRAMEFVRPLVVTNWLPCTQSAQTALTLRH